MLPSSSTDWPFQLDAGPRPDLYRAPAPAQLRHGIALERYLDRQKASRASAISSADLGKALKPLLLTTARIVVRLLGRGLKKAKTAGAPDVDGEALRFSHGRK
jgi:hypothetical protein